MTMSLGQKFETFAVFGWFILAAFVFYRGLTADAPPDLIIMFAAWLGGVASVGVAAATLRVYRRHDRVD